MTTNRFEETRAAITQRIQEIADRRGLTKAEFASVTGMKLSQAYRILGGECNYSLATIVALEIALQEDIISIPTKMRREMFSPFRFIKRRKRQP